MGRRKRESQQGSIWGATQNLAGAPSHPHYARLNQTPDKAGFDSRVVADDLEEAHPAGDGMLEWWPTMGITAARCLSAPEASF
jgi:hypothetical protein